MKNESKIRRWLGWWLVFSKPTLSGRLLAIFRYQEDAEFFKVWIDITIYASRGYSKLGRDRLNFNIRTDGVRQWDGNTGKDLGPAQQPSQFFFNMRSNDAHLYSG